MPHSEEFLKWIIRVTYLIHTNTPRHLRNILLDDNYKQTRTDTIVALVNAISLSLYLKSCC